MSKLLALLKAAALRPEIKLQPQQERVQHKLEQEPGLLVYHGLGSGKTITAINAAEHLGGQREVVVPAALRENFKKELRKVVDQPKDYHIRSYQQAATGGLPPADLTIFDEAHRAGREGTEISQLPEQAAGKVMLLTGTPVRNEPSEILPLLKAIAHDRGVPGSAKAFQDQFIEERKVWPGVWGWLRGVKPGTQERLKNTDELRRLLKGRVDYHPSQGEFPKVEEEDIEVPMQSNQTQLYNALLDASPSMSYKVRNNLPPDKLEAQNLNAFLNGVRQVSNNPKSYDISLQGSPVEHSPKMQKMVSELERHATENPHFKGLVYSNYLESGVLPVSQELTKRGIPNAVFTGELSDKQRQHIVDQYNMGDLKVLLISGAGAEGLDLKGTQLVQIMEPHWNEARIKQVIGRGVRHQSHAHLPPEYQKVQVQRYYAAPQPGWLQRWGLSEKDTGADRYMYQLAQKKQVLVDQLLNILKEVGSEHGETQG